MPGSRTETWLVKFQRVRRARYYCLFSPCRYCAAIKRKRALSFISENEKRLARFIRSKAIFFFLQRRARKKNFVIFCEKNKRVRYWHYFISNSLISIFSYFIYFRIFRKKEQSLSSKSSYRRKCSRLKSDAFQHLIM